MKKSELSAELASRTGLTKTDAAKALAALTDLVTEALVRKEKVQWTGLGTFSVRTRKARNGVNPATGAKIKIAEKTVAAFKASSALAEKVN